MTFLQRNILAVGRSHLIQNDSSRIFKRDQWSQHPVICVRYEIEFRMIPVSRNRITFQLGYKITVAADENWQIVEGHNDWLYIVCYWDCAILSLNHIGTKST